MARLCNSLMAIPDHLLCLVALSLSVPHFLIVAKMTTKLFTAILHYIYTYVYYVLQSQKVATGYANNKIHKEAVKIEI